MDAFERNRRRLEENQRRLDALRMQNNKPAPTERPKQSFFNKVRDQFDANTASDQYRRQQAGDARLYSQQQKDRGIGRVANNPWERTLNLGKSIGESVYATPKRLGQAVEEVVNGNKTQQSFNQLNQTNQKVLNKVNARLANPNLTPAERSIQEDIRQKMIRLQRQGFDEQRKEFSVAADKLDPKKNAAAVADAALTIASAGVAGVAMKTAGQTAAKLGYRAAARQAAPAFFKNMGLNTAQGVTDTVANIGEGRQAGWKDIAKGGAVGATVGSVADVGLGLIPGVIGKRQYDKLLKDLASETDAGIVKQTVAAVNKNLPDEAVDNLSNDIAKAGTPDEVNKLLNEAADAEASVATKAVGNTVDNPTAPKPETPAIPNTAVTPEIVQGFKQAKTPQQARDAVKALFPELDETTANKVIQDISKARDDKTITQILEQAQARRTAVTRGVQDVTPQAEAIAPTPEQQIAEVADNQPTAQLTSNQAPDPDIAANNPQGQVVAPQDTTVPGATNIQNIPEAVELQERNKLLQQAWDNTQDIQQRRYLSQQIADNNAEIRGLLEQADQRATQSLSPTQPELVQSSSDSSNGIISRLRNKLTPLNDGGYIRLPGQPTELMVTHNLSAENLAHAQKLGGIPQASVGIVDPKKHAIDGFGEITLVGSNNLVDPANRGTRTFASDVYSPRQPHGRLKKADGTSRALQEQFSKSMQKYGGEELYIDGSDSVNDALRTNSSVMAQFLEDNGIKPKTAKSEVTNNSLNNQLRDAGLRQRYLEWVTDNAESTYKLSEMDRKKAYLAQNGIKPVPTIDKSQNKYEFSRQIREADLIDRFDKYAIEVAEKAGATNKIYAGTTATAQHRWLDETMDNVLKTMRKERVKAGEQGWGATGSLGSIRAKITKEYRNLEDIVADRSRLTDSETMDATKELLEKKMGDFQSKLEKYAQHQSDNQFTEYDSQMEAIGDYLAGGRDRKWFSQKFENVPESITKELDSFRKELQDAPTEYFESVSDRAVKLNEFEKALIPDNLPKDQREAIVSQLNAEGIQPRFYKEGQRQQALQDLMDEDNAERGFSSPDKTNGKKMNDGGYVQTPGGKDADSLDVPKQDLIIRNGDGKAMSVDPLESLKQEARKYKSAEEFVKAQGEPAYHRSQNKFDKFDISKVSNASNRQNGGWGLYFSDAEPSNQAYGNYLYEVRVPKDTLLESGSPVSESVVSKIVDAVKRDNRNPNELNEFSHNGWLFYKTLGRILGSDKKASLFLARNGVDGLKMNRGSNFNDYILFDDKSIKTKQQLTDLYNQATAPKSPPKTDLLDVATATSLTPENLAAIQPKERINPIDATSQAPVRSLKEKPAKQTFEQVTKEYLGDTGAARIERQGTIADLQKRYKLSNDEKINAILAIDNPSVTPSSPQVAQFIEEYKQLTDSAYKAYTDSGIKMGYVDSYIPRIYKNKETGQLIDRVDYELLQQGTSRVKGREADNVAVDWLVEKDPTKLLERYYDSMDRTVAGKAYLGKLQDNGLVVASSTSVPGLRPIVAEGLQAGDGMVYYAQKDVANKLNELFGSKEANNIVEAALDKAKGVNSLFQSVVLSGGIPNTPLNAFGVMQVLKEAMALHPVKAGKAMVAGMSKEFSDRLFTDKKDILKLMAQNDLDVRIDLTQTGLRGRTRTKNAFKDQGVTGGINQAWNEFTNDATFGRFMPTLEVLHFENIYKAARKRGASIADASALAAESTKNFYGKTSVYKQAVRSKAVDDAAGAFLFAPRFRESMLNFWAKNAKAVAPQNWGKVAYRDNQKFLVASALTFAAMTQVNEALNGVQMWDNPDGKKDKLIIPADALDKLGINTNGKDVAIPFLPSLATVPRNIGMGAYNFATGKDEEGWKNVKSFTSMPISLGMDIATNEDYFGNKIVEDGASPIQRRVQQSAYIAKNAMQPWVREGLNVAGQKLPENTKAKLGIKEKSGVEATSNALELPFRFYNPKYYNYDKQFVPGGKEGEKFNFAEQRDRAKIGGEIKKIADDLDLNKRQRAAYDKLNAVEFNDDGTLKEDSNPFYKVQRYSDLQDDKVFEAIKKRSELNAKLNGKPIDPIFDESVTPEQRRVLLWKKTLPPGTSDPTVKKLYEQDWYHDYQNKEDAYYDQKTAWNKQMGYKEPAQSTNPYPKATPELQSAMDYYFTLPKGTGARSNWIKGNGGLWNQMIGYWESKDAWTNGERSKVGLGNVDDENTDGSGGGKGKFGKKGSGGSGGKKKDDTPKTYIGQLLGDVPSVSSNEINIKTTPKRAKLKVKTPSGKGRNYKKIKLG